MKEAVSPAELAAELSSGSDIQVLDVRLAEDRTPVVHYIPGACWRDPNNVEKWAGEIDLRRRVVVFCVHGLRVSKGVRQALAERGFDAYILNGGIDAWEAYAKSE